jgi:hypothetical protein
MPTCPGYIRSRTSVQRYRDEGQGKRGEAYRLGCDSIFERVRRTARCAGWKSSIRQVGNLRYDLGDLSALPFVHFGTGSLEDLFFARGQALDAVRGDFIENGIDFAADEFFGLNLFGLWNTAALGSPETRFDGRGFDKLSTAGAVAQWVPVEGWRVVVKTPPDKCEAGNDSAKVCGVGDAAAAPMARAASSLVRPSVESSSKSNDDVMASVDLRLSGASPARRAPTRPCVRAQEAMA